MTKKILLLGSGELGKEFVIAAQRLGQTVVACDSYAGAPAMQVADACEVFDMLDGDALAAAVAKHHPDIIVPEIEAIRTERLYDFEREGVQVVPSALADNPRTDLRIFGKPSARINRRMGVVVGYEPLDGDLEALRDRVKAAAARIRVTE